MRIRFRIGPFTFGKSGTRLSLWRGGTGISIPLSNRKNTQSFGKIRFGIFSFYFNEKKEKQITEKYEIPEYIKEIRKTHKQAYETWSAEDDEKLVLLYRQGKTIKELSKIFERTNGAIRARIDKILYNNDFRF